MNLRLDPGVGRLLAGALLVAAAAILPYLGALHAPFTLDDVTCIVGNPAIRDLGALLDPSTWDLAGARCGGRGRWLGLLSFAASYRVGGLDPLPWHVANVALHAAASLTVYWLGLLVARSSALSRAPDAGAPFPGRLLALLAALLFAVHPLQTQAVTYLTQRFTSLATLLALLAVALHARARLPGPRAGRLAAGAASLAAAWAAMSTKEIAFTLPALVALLEVAFLDGPARRRLLGVAPFAALLCARLLATYRTPAAVPVLGVGGAALGSMGGAGAPPWGDYLLTQLPATVTYLGMLLLPAGQSIDHAFPLHRSVADPAVLLSGLALAAAAVAAVRQLSPWRRPRPSDPFLRVAAFGFLWFLAALSVEAVVPLSDLLVEHRAYLPSVGFFLAVSALLLLVRDRIAPRAPVLSRAVVPAMLLAAAALAAATVARNEVWASEERLWADASRQAPGKVRPREWYVRTLLAPGRLPEAEREARDLVRHAPLEPRAHVILGVVLARQGRLAEAEAEHRRALALQPGLAEAHANLGLVWKTAGRLAEAEGAFRTALALDPGAAGTHNDLGAMLARQGRLDEAVREFRAALETDPLHAGAAANLSTALREQAARGATAR